MNIQLKNDTRRALAVPTTMSACVTSLAKVAMVMMIAFSPLLAAAQADSSVVVLRFNGGLADMRVTNGAASINAVSSDNRNWNVGFTVGTHVGKRWEVGFGFEYQKQKTLAESSMTGVPAALWFTLEQTETDVHLTIGKVYMAGRWQLLKGLYFHPILSAGIGKAKGDQTSTTFTSSPLSSSSYPSSVFVNVSDIAYKYFAVGLAPAFSYYFNRHFALNLELGGFQFTTIDWEWDNKQLLANVNPAYWQLGIIVAF